MGDPAGLGAVTADRARRRYDGTRRREQAAGTRERIVAAGAELLQASSIRDWQALTMRAVAERAGVSERTVYRHVGSERGLRDAVMHRLEQQTGIDLAAMALDDIADVAQRILGHVAAYPRTPAPALDPTLADANQRQRRALLDAIAGHTAGWPEADRAVVAGLFDVLWSVGTYERLVVDWRLDHDRAVAGTTWVIGLVADAVRAGHRPAGPRSPSERGAPLATAPSPPPGRRPRSPRHRPG
jgi:AcrR family transcriptional regulator